MTDVQVGQENQDDNSRKSYILGLIAEAISTLTLSMNNLSPKNFDAIRVEAERINDAGMDITLKEYSEAYGYILRPLIKSKIRNIVDTFENARFDHSFDDIADNFAKEAPELVGFVSEDEIEEIYHEILKEQGNLIAQGFKRIALMSVKEDDES